MSTGQSPPALRVRAIPGLPVQLPDQLPANLLRAALLLCFLTPLVYTPETIYPFNIGKSLYIRALVSALFPLYLALAALRPAYRPKLTAVAAAAALVLAVTVVAGLAGESPTVSFWSTYTRAQGIVETLHLFALAVMVAALFRPRTWRIALLATMVVVNTVVVALGLIAFYEVVGLPYLDHARRLYSTVGQPMFLSAHCTASMVVALMLWAHLPEWRKSPPQLLAAAALTFLMGLNVWCIYLSSGRLAVVALIVVAGFISASLALLSPRPAVRIASAAFLVATLLLVTAIALLMFTDRFDRDRGYETLVNRTSRTFQGRDNSALGRMGALRTGYQSFMDHPALGIGPELFDRAWMRHITVQQHNGNIFDQAHNKVVEVAVTTGAAGLAAYGLLAGAIAVAFGKLIRRTRHGNLPLSVFTAALFVNYAALAMFLFDTTSFLLIFATMLAFAMLAEQDHPHRWTQCMGRIPRWQPTGALRFAPHCLCALAVIAVAAGAVHSQRLNFDFYRGAHARDAQGDVGRTLAAYTASVHAFPPMATSIRVPYTLELLPQLRRMNQHQKRTTLPFLVHQLELAHRADPNNWKVHYASALLLSAIADERPDFAGRARWHLQRLTELSPSSYYTAEVGNILSHLPQ